MSQSFVRNLLHVIFSTKSRSPYLREKEIRERTHGYLKGILDNWNCPRIQIGGVDDHVHILFPLSQNIKLADLIRELKRDSSKWLKTVSPALRQFQWQTGYGAFSVSPGHVPVLSKYIANQEAHHRKESFQDELRRICRKYGVALDELQAWD